MAANPHTPEPWTFQGIGLNYDLTARASLTAAYVGVRIAKVFSANKPLGFGDSPPREIAEANARRIVAAINACAGISTEALEAVANAKGGRLNCLMDAAQEAGLQAYLADRIGPAR